MSATDRDPAFVLLAVLHDPDGETTATIIAPKAGGFRVVITVSDGVTVGIDRHHDHFTDALEFARVMTNLDGNIWNPLTDPRKKR